MFSEPQKFVRVNTDWSVIELDNYQEGLMLLINSKRFEEMQIEEMGSIRTFIYSGQSIIVGLAESYTDEVDILIMKYGDSFTPLGAFPVSEDLLYGDIIDE